MFLFFKQKTAYEMRISDWSSDVCSSDLLRDDLTIGYGAALGVPGDIGLAQMTNLTKWTQELRLQSPVSDTFEWLVGGYYTHENVGLFQRIDVLDPGTLTVDPMMPQFHDILTTSTYAIGRAASRERVIEY